MLCYQSILAARVKLLDLEKIVDRVIRFLKAAMAEKLRRSVESFRIAVKGVADEPKSIPPRAMRSSTTSSTDAIRIVEHGTARRHSLAQPNIPAGEPVVKPICTSAARVPA